MVWKMEEAIGYYRSQGAPQDQNALINLLKEVQQENGGVIPEAAVTDICCAYGIKDSYLLAIIRRIPSLRLSQTHVLEVCAGPNCGKHTRLAAFAQALQKKGISVRFVPCMRLCGKGPNIRWDGKLYHGADEGLLRRLSDNSFQN